MHIYDANIQHGISLLKGSRWSQAAHDKCGLWPGYDSDGVVRDPTLISELSKLLHIYKDNAEYSRIVTTIEWG